LVFSLTPASFYLPDPFCASPVIRRALWWCLLPVHVWCIISVKVIWVHKVSNTAAAETAVDLAKLSIQASEGWSKSDDVILFIEKIYSYLVSGEMKPDAPK